MDAIMAKAAQVMENHGVREDKQPTHSRLPSERTETAMVGFGEELIQLIDELTQHRSNRHTISIVGMGGVGKTTLAKSVYDNPLIKHYFDVRAWATVSQQYNVEGIFSQLLSCLRIKNDSKDSGLGIKDDSKDKLYKTLFGRRYLIVLDDIWSVEVWDEIKNFFPNTSRSCIVVTTRFSNVARYCGCSCLSKKHLNENEGWKLFCNKAFQNEVCPPELETIGKKIVKLCKGLPLSIVVTGGRLLKSPRAVEYWENVANDLKSIPNSEEKQESLDVLISSYNHLPPHLKPCFLHMGVFKWCLGSIYVSKIINLWVAEGFIKSNGTQMLEEIAEDYLKDLIDRNLILVGGRSDSGKMKYCDIHDLLRDLCIKVVEQPKFSFVDKGRIRGIERYFTFDDWMSEEHRLLRILETRLPLEPKELSRCVNLRYVNLYRSHWNTSSRYPVVEGLLTSLSLQWNLQTLIVLECYRISIDIWKMQQLRYVKCDGIYVPDPCVNDGFILENLHTLKTAVNLRLSEQVCKIIPNIKKLHLHYNSKCGDNDLEYLCNLCHLHKLESLKLDCFLQRDSKLNKILKFPISLIKLTLICCHLHWDDLTMIGSLPNLEVLNLEYASVSKGQHWSPIDGQFLRLRFLRIHGCDLVCWNADSFHFPVLEKLVLEGLEKLEEIPLGIAEIYTLKLIRVETCSVSAMISAVRILEKHLEDYGKQDLQIQVKMYNFRIKSFMQMVEKQGLTIDNVELETWF